MVAAYICLLAMVVIAGTIFMVWTCYALCCAHRKSIYENSVIWELLAKRRLSGASGARLQNRESIYRSYQDHLTIVHPILKKSLHYKQNQPAITSRNSLTTYNTMEDRRYALSSVSQDNFAMWIWEWVKWFLLLNIARERCTRDSLWHGMEHDSVWYTFSPLLYAR